MQTANTDDTAFTLIELLVVIAIIGLLSSVVLASLSGAREDAKESAILSSLNNARTQAELYYSKNGSYEYLCDNDSKVADIRDSLASTADGAACFDPNSGQSGVNSSEAGDLIQRDWGMAVKLDDTFYVGSPQGVGTMDDASKELSSKTWDEAKNYCDGSGDKGARLASLSELRALYDIDSSPAPGDFSLSHYWSSLASRQQSDRAFRVTMSNGLIYRNDVGLSRSVRCVH